MLSYFMMIPAFYVFEHGYWYLSIIITKIRAGTNLKLACRVYMIMT